MLLDNSSPLTRVAIGGSESEMSGMFRDELMHGDGLEGNAMRNKSSTILIWALLLVFVLFLVGMGFIWWSGSGEDTAGGWSDNIEEIEENVPGLWVAEGSTLGIAFAPDGEYQILNYQGKTIIGDWEVTDDGLIAAPVSYRNYSGVWYFEPADEDTLTLEVEELELSEMFHKDY